MPDHWDVTGSTVIPDWQVLSAARLIAAGSATPEQAASRLAALGLTQRVTTLAPTDRSSPGWLARRISELRTTDGVDEC